MNDFHSRIKKRMDRHGITLGEPQGNRGIHLPHRCVQFSNVDKFWTAHGARYGLASMELFVPTLLSTAIKNPPTRKQRPFHLSILFRSWALGSAFCASILAE